MYFYGSIYSCSLDMAVSITHIIKVNLNRTKKWKYYYVEKQKGTLIQQTMKNQNDYGHMMFLLCSSSATTWPSSTSVATRSLLLSKLKPKM